MNQEFLNQLEQWNEEDQYQKIIDAIEALPEEALDFTLTSALARAYNNLAIDVMPPEDRPLYQRALDLLLPLEGQLEEAAKQDPDTAHTWNFRVAYAYYYLNQESQALPHFEKALEARPGDEDTLEFIDRCQQCLALPLYMRPFRGRTEEGWSSFLAGEGELRALMDQEDREAVSEQLVARCSELLSPAFSEVAFELGRNGEKYELILVPEGDRTRMFQLAYFQKRAPQEVLDRWNILVGRQPAANMGLRSGEWEISGDDVRIRLEQTGEKSFALFAYCEKLLPLLPEEEGRAWWMLTTLTDQVLGEIPHMRYIDAFHVLHEPGEEPCILLTELPGKLQDMGLDLSSDPEAYLEGSYTGYRMEPNEDPNGDWRLDVIAGSTNCTALVSEYLNNENGYMDALHADGAAAGFFCYPLESFTGENRSQQIFDFRDKLEAALREGAGGDCVTLTGGATGIYCGYVDFIAWDLLTVLTQARAFFENSHIPWADFHVFRRDAGTVALKARKE